MMTRSLNSLCQFDILYCLLVVAEGQTRIRSFYPFSTAFDETRADPALVTVAGDSEVRATLFPDSSDAEVAKRCTRWCAWPYRRRSGSAGGGRDHRRV
jgi:hypothetical protein